MPIFFIRAIWRLRTDPHFGPLAGMATLSIATGTLVYSIVEHMRVIDALYMSTVTLATVGYGDYTPHTDFGKLFTVFYVLIGVGILLSFVTKVAGQAIDDRIEAHAAKQIKLDERRTARAARKRAA
jgi:voltage-gated potassium channel